MKIITTILLIFISTFTFAQGGAMADLKFEEAEIAFNKQDYETTIKKLDEFDKLLGSIKDKSLYLRIISQDKLFEPSKLYENESQFNLQTSLRKNASAYLKAMESNGLDERYREVYAINEKLANYPIEKTVWIKEKQKSDLEKQEAEKKNKELEDFYRELTPKIEAWEWDEKIKIGKNIKSLKKLYPEFYKPFDGKYNSVDKLNINIINWGSKNILNLRDLEVKVIVAENDIITHYVLELSETSKIKFLDKWEKEFGEKAISEYLSDDGNVGMYVLQSPISNIKIYIQYVKINGYPTSYNGGKIKNGEKDFFKFYKKIK
ncbi:hypothetical protein [Flavobacterium magnesitis]|uniref:hypothetical protein n=1 Tax=Flavobacterium magnesitis TaxID=3138077 RepID=UPI00358F711F